MKKRLFGILLSFALMLTMMPVLGLSLSAYADDAPHTHDSITFQEWQSSNSLPSSGGSYYLTNNVTLSSSWDVTKNISLCLNGHTITGPSSEPESYVIHINGGTLNLYDCNSDFPGHITGGGNGVYIDGESSTFNMYGGVINDNSAYYGGGVLNYGTFTMNGGTITGNNADELGGGVRNSRTFNMYGGVISNNTASDKGGGIYNSGTFNMYGGVISNNTATLYGGGVHNSGEFTMSGNSEIINNKANGSYGGGGVYNAVNTFTMNGGKIQGNEAVNRAGVSANGGTFTMNGGEISGNIASEGIGGVYAQNPFTMTGGKIINNKAADTCGGVYAFNTFKLSGDAVIKDNLKGSDKSNVYLPDGEKITVTGALGENASIGVTMETPPGVFTNTEDDKLACNDASKFSSDDVNYVVIKNNNKQLELSPAFTVTYKVVNGTWSDGTTTDKTEAVASGAKPAGVPTGMKASEGYTGGAWDKNPAETTITGATTFTYIFSKKDPDPAKESTITYDLNGGTLNGQTGLVTVKAENGTVITLPAPTRDGYTFDYWEGSKYNAGDKYTVNGDHTFKAIWKTADKGGGSDSDNKGGSSKKGVKTGDENALGAWIVLLVAALTGTTGMVFARKRK